MNTQNGIMDPLIAGTTPLRPGNAAAAIIMVDNDGYLMQQRDPRPDIWYPGYWGLFGGSIEPDERAAEALARELDEELELKIEPEQLQFFMNLDFDLGTLGLGRYFRAFYTLQLSHTLLDRLVLREGALMRVFPGEEILCHQRVTPYDSFALFLHYSRSRIA